ncbi:MAG: hypothetical protein RMH84_00570 [Sulfolobales archaeon]|nr:hypothetical protein [Sulfolobales archaeon]MCX8208099.1 hypothetical protein [Sulfolobales archaeon]MDW8010080.1 hypothetical protein [Sulfolobales archaeon]
MSKNPDRYEFYSKREFRERELAEPKPLGSMCNNLCPLFRCARNALVLSTKVVKGYTQKVAMCRLTGDQCIGYRCQFAYCDRRALLPSGNCAFTVKFKDGEEFFSELEKEELELASRSKLVKKFSKKDMFLE